MNSLWRKITGTLPVSTTGSNENLSEIICIVDRSGSMEPIRNDAIGGFNAFVDDQQQLPGEANLTLILFDDNIKHLHDAVPVKSIEPLTRKTYIPRGRTALYDAIGYTIIKVSNRLAKQDDQSRPGKVIVSILTDGEENSSRKFNREKIARMIQDRQEKEGWIFYFLAANQDAFAAADQISISRYNTVSFKANASGVSQVYQEMNTLVTQSRIDIPPSKDKNKPVSDVDAKDSSDTDA